MPVPGTLNDENSVLDGYIGGCVGWLLGSQVVANWCFQARFEV
jgi:hypothetical protein